jgi:hypothetical protein
MWLLLYMVPLKILQVVFQADPGFQSVHALQTVILEHFNCTLILKWKLSHLVFRSF